MPRAPRVRVPKRYGSRVSKRQPTRQHSTDPADSTRSGKHQTPPGDDHLRPSISCSLPDAAAFWVSSLPPRWTPPMKTLGTCLGPG